MSLAGGGEQVKKGEHSRVESVNPSCIPDRTWRDVVEADRRSEKQ